MRHHYVVSARLRLLSLFLLGCQTFAGNDEQKLTSDNSQATPSEAVQETAIAAAEQSSNIPAADVANNTAPAVDISHKYQYKVRGKRYKVFASSKNFQQIGNASWYGPGFHGKLTANGEVYNMHAMTAAHKTLPLGCKVQVTNLNNGRKIIVRINDRGPFHGGRIIDLSKAAAKKLDILKSGYAKVHVKIIE